MITLIAYLTTLYIVKKYFHNVSFTYRGRDGRKRWSISSVSEDFLIDLLSISGADMNDLTRFDSGDEFHGMVEESCTEIPETKDKKRQKLPD